MATQVAAAHSVVATWRLFFQGVGWEDWARTELGLQEELALPHTSQL